MSRMQKLVLAGVAVLAGAQLFAAVSWCLFDYWPLVTWLDWLESRVPLITIAPEG